MSVNLDFQCSRVSPSEISGGVGTAVKYFPRPFGLSIRSRSPNFRNLSPLPPSNGSLPSTPSATNATGALWVPANPATEGAQLHVQASGTFGGDYGDPSGTVTVQLYAVTGSVQAPIYTPIASTGAITPSFSEAQPWFIDATLTADSLSQMLVGYYTSVSVGGTLNSSPKGLDNIVTGITFGVNSSGPVTNGLPPGVAFGLVIGVTFGTSDATNKAFMTQFTIS